MRIRASPDMDFFRPGEKEESPSLIFFLANGERSLRRVNYRSPFLSSARGSIFATEIFVDRFREMLVGNPSSSPRDFIYFIYFPNVRSLSRTSGKNVVACRRFTFFPIFFSSFLYLCCFGPLSIIFHRGDGKVRIRHYVE